LGGPFFMSGHFIFQLFIGSLIFERNQITLKRLSNQQEDESEQA